MQFLYQRVSDTLNRQPLSELEKSVGIIEEKSDNECYARIFKMTVFTTEGLLNMSNALGNDLILMGVNSSNKLPRICLYDGYAE